MRHPKLLVYFIVAIVLSACKKESVSTYENQIRDSFIDSAVQFLKANLSNDEVTKLDLTTVVKLKYLNHSIGLKVYETGNSLDKFILLNRVSQGFLANRVSISNMKALISAEHNGTIKLESLDKKNSTNLIIRNNKVVEILKSFENQSNSVLLHDSIIDQSKNDFPIDRNNLEDYKILPPVVITIYQGSAYYDYWSLYWLSNQNGGYSGLYLSPNDGGGSGSSGAGKSTNNTGSGRLGSDNNVTAMPKFSSPVKPIRDLKDELKCFTNNSLSSYSISVNVNQPWPDSRDKIDPTATFVVGHTFLTLRQTNPDGSEIIRNVGFYPKNFSKPGSSVDQSTFGDDTYTGYNVSLKMTVSGSELNSVINTLVDQQSKNFDLNNFNCTNSAMDALKSINVNLPSTKSGDEILFNGNNPSDLGQDIRGLNLNDFSQNNGNRNVTRTASNSNDQKPDTKKGSC